MSRDRFALPNTPVPADSMVTVTDSIMTVARRLEQESVPNTAYSEAENK